MEVISGSIEERIIKASFEILEKEGISNATTKKIAEQAGVSEVTLFRKFKTKKNLIDVSKEYYSQHMIERLSEIFEFSPEIPIEEYLKTRFEKVVNLTDEELNIIKVGMEEVRNIPSQNKLFLKISGTIINKLSEFFTMKIILNEIRNVNPQLLALNVFSIMFDGIILWKVYEKDPQDNIDTYINDFLDIFLNGIKSE